MDHLRENGQDDEVVPKQPETGPPDARMARLGYCHLTSQEQDGDLSEALTKPLSGAGSRPQRPVEQRRTPAEKRRMPVEKRRTPAEQRRTPVGEPRMLGEEPRTLAGGLERQCPTGARSRHLLGCRRGFAEGSR